MDEASLGQLCELLSHTLSHEGPVRATGEQGLAAVGKAPGFAERLLAVSSHEGVPLDVRVSAAVHLKKAIAYPLADLVGALLRGPTAVSKVLVDAAAQLCRAPGSLSPPDGWHGLPTALAAHVAWAADSGNPAAAETSLDALHSLTRRLKTEAVANPLLQRDVLHLAKAAGGPLLAFLRAAAAASAQAGGGGSVAEARRCAAELFTHLTSSAEPALLAGVLDVSACLSALLSGTPDAACVAAAAVHARRCGDARAAVTPHIPALLAAQDPAVKAAVLRLLAAMAPHLDTAAAEECARCAVAAAPPAAADLESMRDHPTEYARGTTPSARRAGLALLEALLAAQHREAVVRTVLPALDRMLADGGTGSGSLSAFAGATVLATSLAKAGCAEGEVRTFFGGHLLGRLEHGPGEGTGAAPGDELRDAAVSDALCFTASFGRRCVAAESLPDMLRVVARWLVCGREAVVLSACCAVDKLLAARPALSAEQAAALLDALLACLRAADDAGVAQTLARVTARFKTLLDAPRGAAALVALLSHMGGGVEPATLHYVFEALASLVAEAPRQVGPVVAQPLLALSRASPDLHSRYALHVLARTLLLCGASPLAEEDVSALCDGVSHGDRQGCLDVLSCVVALDTARSPRVRQHAAGLLVRTNPAEHAACLGLVRALVDSLEGPGDVHTLLAEVAAKVRCDAGGDAQALVRPAWFARDLRRTFGRAAARFGSEVVCSSPAVLRVMEYALRSVHGGKADEAEALGCLRVACEGAASVQEPMLVLLLEVVARAAPHGSEDAESADYCSDEDEDEDEDEETDAGECDGGTCEGERRRMDRPVVLAALCGLPAAPASPALPFGSVVEYVAAFRRQYPERSARFASLTAPPALQPLLALFA